MFIIEKSIEDVDNTFRKIIGDNNIKLINDYFKGYDSIIDNVNKLKEKDNNLTQLKDNKYNLLFNDFNVLHSDFTSIVCMQFKIDDVESEIKKAKNKLNSSVEKLEKVNDVLENSDIFKKLDSSHNLHVLQMDIDPRILSATYDEVLQDILLNNELDLIKDYLNDFDTLKHDTELSKKENANTINHDFTKLNLRLHNITMQNELVDTYRNGDQDALLMCEIIGDSYKLLLKSLDEGITDSEIEDYKEKMNFTIEQDLELDSAIKKYSKATLDDVKKYRRKDSNKKKVK